MHKRTGRPLHAGADRLPARDVRSWVGRLPRLQTLRTLCCGVEGDSDHAFPGLASLSSLTRLEFSGLITPTRWPSGLWRLPLLRVLEYTVTGNVHENQPNLSSLSRAALPPAWSQFQGLQELTLRQGFQVFPAVVTQVTTLTRLWLAGNSFEVVPTGITALKNLDWLTLGRRTRDECSDLDVRALGCLSAFSRLRCLDLSMCAVTFCADFANAAHHPTFEVLEFEGAYAVAGQSRAAVLAYALEAKAQGRGRALLRPYLPEDVRGVRQQDVHELQAALEAGGLLPEDLMSENASEEESEEE